MVRRRELMGMQSGRLPGEYRRVEYLENPANKTTYIDTGIYITEDIRLEIDFQYEGPTDTVGYFMGIWQGTSFFLYVGQTLLFQTGFGTDWQNTSIHVDNNRHRFLYKIVDGYLYVLEGGMEILKKAFYAASPRPIYVAGTVQGNARACKTFSSKIWENGNLIQSLTPCIRKSDNKPGMYDTVSKTFYTNAGTGEFIVPN